MNAVLSDVHGNLPALEAVLDDLYYHPIDRIIFAGDFIGGPQPVETFLRHSSVEGIMITGNSDTNLTKLRTGQAPREWHVRRILRERGIPLVGQKPETMLQRIPLKALLGEINMTMLQEMEVFQNEINRPLRFWSSRFGQSFLFLNTAACYIPSIREQCNQKRLERNGRNNLLTSNG